MNPVDRRIKSLKGRMRYHMKRLENLKKELIDLQEESDILERLEITYIDTAKIIARLVMVKVELSRLIEK